MVAAEAEEAVDELRTLAHGIYPPVLRSGGVVQALRSLAIRAPIAISVTDEGIGRCSPSVEAANLFLLGGGYPERDQARGQQRTRWRDRRS